MSKPVLHILTTSSWGGLEMYVVDLIRALKETGITQGIYLLPDTLLEKAIIDLKGVHVYHAHKRSKWSWKDVRNLHNAVQQQDYQTLHAHTNIDVYPCVWLRQRHRSLRIIFSLYMGTVPKRDFFHRWIWNQIDFLVSSSSYTNSEVAEHYALPAHKIKLVRYGRDVEMYIADRVKSQEIRTQLAANQDTLVVGCMARIDQGKGILDLAQAFSYLPENLRQKVQIWLIGERNIEGIDTNGNKSYQKESQATWEILQQYLSPSLAANGVKSISFQKDYLPWLGAMDVFCLASWKEMYSLSVIDAMLMGLPVIGTNEGGTTEQIEAPKRGLVVPIKNPKALAKAIEFMALNMHQRNEMGEKASVWAARTHAWSHVKQTFIALYL